MFINVTFDNLEEMRLFAETVLGGGVASAQQVAPLPVQAMTPPTPPVALPVQQPVQQPVQPPAPPAPPVQQLTPPAPPVQQLTPPAPPVQPVTPVQTSAPSYTVDDLAKAAMTLMDSGRQSDLITLLQNFGLASLPELQPEQYGAFATALRGLGAQI